MNKKISELPAADLPLSGAEKVEIVQGGINKQVDSSELGGGGSGAVDSVNGQTGVVVLDAGDVGADPAGTAAAAAAAVPRSFAVACSDEVTPITAATNKVKFRMPFAMTLSSVRASLSTAQTSGSIFTVDINESGSTILSTKLTIDNGETTSTTAATPPVISDSDLADNAEISIDVDQVGDNTAKGLKVYFIGV